MVKQESVKQRAI